MHPAPSIIVFTTLSGLGYGLACALGLGLFDPAALATKAGWVLALALVAAGLSSSTLHLGNPQRAWRAFSQWRSSWLSREGVMAVVTFLPLAASAWLCVVESRYSVVAGLIGSALCLVTVFCTAMIYASLKSVQAWHTPLTPLCYLLFALAGGCVAASFLAFCGAGMSSFFAPAAVILLAAAWTARRFWRRRMLDMRPLSTPESATGLSAIGRVRLFERPHMTENYLTREMGFKVARKHAGKLWRLALLVGAVVPVVLLFFLLIGSAQPGWPAALVAGVAALASLLGIVVERWLFFAEARHAVMNYYGG
ncbi:DmsC/YnfH family molybdoenzyme membrane anchor subunit [Mesorhizobium sp. CN5-321]|jgi:DMSO reductase anchor subunit|uniref:dimethyl sulfoxide reductase anchor subunit family protein n=1 Tax=Mesorhizobium hunchu TaxID=3157708 RepID=UPI0032B78183